MIRSILVDDEKHCTEMLLWELKNNCPTVEVVAVCHSGSDAIAAIKKHQPDLVFLDIEMPRMNGFEMLRQLDPLSFEVVFTTAYDQFAIQAIKISALDYLLKPIGSTELIAALKKYEDRPNSGPDDQRMQILFDHLKDPLQKEKRIALPSQDEIQVVLLADIIYCQSDANYTQVKLADTSNILVSRTLKYYEETLKNYAFLRVHHSYVVNLSHVTKYVKSDGGYLIMSEKSTVPVSRRRKDELVERLMSF